MLYRGARSPWALLRTTLAPQSPPIKTGDRGLRQLAIKAPRPIYPPTSLAKRVTGVVVATVTIDVNGQLKNVNIVESPDAATARAVREAVTQWVFRSVTVPSAANLIRGNLIFYFHFNEGRGLVSSSDELQATKPLALRDNRQTQRFVKSINEAEFDRLRSTIAYVVLDIRSRTAHVEAHRDGAVNIPLAELRTRGGAELPRSRLIVIDCFVEQQYSGLCNMAVHVLTADGFSEVAVLNRNSG